jgi:Protein of unknown function (DUF3048) N-terminal domain/Protein of unknown function (DUF3048) C-terminal domain
MVDDIRPQAKQTPDPEPQEPVFQAEPIKLEPAHSYSEPKLPEVAPFDVPHTNGRFTPEPEPKSNPLDRIKDFWKNLSKKQRILFGVIALVIVLLLGGGVYALTKDDQAPTTQTPTSKKKAATATKPTTEPSRLTGLPVDPEVNKRPVTSIQIENSPSARPQSGLKDAGVVFEAIAEGGITRFNASFLEAQPDYIGPIRSVRPYYAVLAAPFDPIFVHAGGSAQGLGTLKILGLKDLDHGANGNAFQRVGNREAPHNLYSSTTALDKASQARGYTSSDVKSFERKAEQKNLPITAKMINLSISSPLYNVSYNYDQASNTYPRTLGGQPHTDEKTGTQIAPKVVVALVMNYSQSGIYSVYQTTGTGTAFVFQDGTVTQATWNKPNDQTQFTFTDASGKPVKLDAGQTWLTLVKATSAVTYAP